LRRRHQVPAWTVVVLLRPVADGPELTGVHEQSFPGLGQNLWFRYDVVRVWLQSPEKLLTAGLPVLPLAPVSNVAPERLPEILTAVAERLKREAEPNLMKMLWTSTTILMGLYHPKEYVYDVTKEPMTMILGIRGIEESSVYQDIFAKGKAEGEAKGIAKSLLRMGSQRLGQPDERVIAAILGMTDQEQLNRLVDRVMDAATWEELLSSTE
jgi:hypothetical protein